MTAVLTKNAVSNQVAGQAAGMTPLQKFQLVRQELRAGLIERTNEIDMALIALACREHVLMIGPPGTGKSMLANSLCSWLHGNLFSLLIGKYTTPEELIGPVSLQALKQDRYLRVTTGRLPECDIAFIDEIFKASSAILNTMLQLLNERTFTNDGQLITCPLRLCIAASNEWPTEQKELGALFDRFLFRTEVRCIGSDRGLDQLLWTKNLKPVITQQITVGELDQAHYEVLDLDYSQAAMDALKSIQRRLKSEGIMIGDRRLRKAVQAGKAAAWLAGHTIVEPEHLEVLEHVLWQDVDQHKKTAEIVGEVANPDGLKVNSLLLEAQTVMTELGDMSDIAKLIPASKKLAEIHRSLGKIPGQKSADAQAFIAAESQRIKAESIKGMSL